ncbi:hypothetical protein ABZ383_22015 [Streptomyces sp. NPDC005900]|uniref:hypothetical protein n=1 Tax=unclassified Streptomyces TaxID=2593676 RepID=UPI0033E51C56
MAATTHSTPRDPGDTWLAESAACSELAYAVWDSRGLVLIHCTQWLAAEVQLQTAMQAVQRIPPSEQGPLLVDVRMDKAWWLMPLDAREQLADVPQILVLPLGWPLRCPSTQRAVGSRVWLEAPDGTGRLMYPVYLAAALDPGGGPRLPAEAFG